MKMQYISPEIYLIPVETVAVMQYLSDGGDIE